MQPDSRGHHLLCSFFSFSALQLVSKFTPEHSAPSSDSNKVGRETKKDGRIFGRAFGVPVAPPASDGPPCSFRKGKKAPFLRLHPRGFSKCPLFLSKQAPNDRDKHTKYISTRNKPKIRDPTAQNTRQSCQKTRFQAIFYTFSPFLAPCTLFPVHHQHCESILVILVSRVWLLFYTLEF